MIRLWADFDNSDEDGRINLNCVGSLASIGALASPLRPGTRVLLSDDQVEVEGVIEFDDAHGVWVAIPDWSTIENP